MVVFSSVHPSGEQLNNLGGLAALLRYPFDMCYLDEEEEAVTSEDEEGSVDLDIEKYKNMVQEDLF